MKSTGRRPPRIARPIHAKLRDDTGYRAILQLTGIGPVFGGIFVAEVGDVSRFANPKKLCCWAGLTPRLRESDTKTIQEPITKQGSKLVRSAAIEAVARYRGGAPICDTFIRVAEKRGINRAKVAVARKLSTLMYFGLRDGEIRCLTPDREQAA